MKTVSLVLDSKAQAVIAALKLATRAESAAHVLRDALGVYNALFEMLTRGETLAVVNRAANEMRELTFPSLQRKARAVSDLIEQSSVGQGLAALKADPDAELQRLDDELTPEVMDQLRAWNAEQVSPDIEPELPDRDVDVFEAAYTAADEQAMASVRYGIDVRKLERICTRAGIDAVLRERAKEER